MVINHSFSFMRVPTSSKLISHLNRVAAGECSRGTDTIASEYGARQCNDGSGNSKERYELECNHRVWWCRKRVKRQRRVKSRSGENERDEGVL